MRAKACSLVLYEMYNKSISAGESIVDLATRTLERKPMLWVIASGAIVTKCRRQWRRNLLFDIHSDRAHMEPFSILRDD